jgi:lipopolysaccharide/colanic/teichoic acid biosynthesis glycosyltransferase
MDYPVIKRCIDIGMSALALCMLMPLLVFVAVIIMLDSPGSPLFLQPRIGLGGKTFTIVKFRSMVKNASQIGSWQTSNNDARINRVGKFIRTTSIDELPQLWNVLIGEMSLVGPRPETPAQQSLYEPADWEIRHRVRPGITGLSQVSGRSNLTTEERLKYDLAYASAPTPAMDISILLKTIWHVICRTGVN